MHAAEILRSRRKALQAMFDSSYESKGCLEFIALVFSSALNCIINFYNIPIDRPPTKKALKIISNSDTSKILIQGSIVFNNFVSINKIFVKNNLSIDKIEDINLIKEDFWFLCLNNVRFAVGDNSLPDDKKCKSLDNNSLLNLEKEIRLPDYLLKKYIIQN